MKLPRRPSFIFRFNKVRSRRGFISDKEGRPKGFISEGKNPERREGFTLVELLVVITIIGILTGIAVVSFTGAQQKAKIGRAKAEMESLKSAMNMYYLSVGELPPRGDNCSACSNPPNSSWTLVIDALLSNDGAGWDGPYLDQRINNDPWGNYYGYDDNAGVCCGFESYIRSAGPDKSLWTADDIHLTVMRDND